MESQEYTVKLLVVGDSGVGKTCLLLRYSDDKFVESHLITIGIDFKVKSINLEGKSVKLQIVRCMQWDSAGQERFHKIAPNFYRNAMGFMLVYDVTDEQSFVNVARWAENITKHRADAVVKVLIGNKTDLPNRMVSRERGEALAAGLGMRHFEASAKRDENIREVFEYTSAQVLKNYDALASAPASVKVSASVQKKKKCC
jgi:small GTP-binding protein